MNPQIFRFFLPCLCVCIAVSSSSYGQPASGPRTLDNLIEGGQGGAGDDGTTPAATPPSLGKSSSAVRQILDKASGEVKKHRETLEKAVEKNRKDYDKANEKPLGEAKRELQDLAKKLIEDGKTDEATAVLAQVKTLDVDVMRMANAPMPLADGGGLQKPLLERMAGKWRRAEDNIVYVISSNGVIQCSNGDQGKLNSASPEAAEFIFRSGWKFSCRMATKDIACAFQWDPSGQRMPSCVLERMK